MKGAILLFAALTALCFGIAKGIDEFGGDDTRVNMDAVPWEMLGLAFGAVDVVLVVAYALLGLLA